MTISLSAPRRMRISSDNRELAEVLLAEWFWTMDQALLDHEGGWHVGREYVGIACGACGPNNDMPSKPTMTREEYLDRNIGEVVAVMRMNASFVDRS